MYLSIPAPSSVTATSQAFRVVKVGLGHLPADSLALLEHPNADRTTLRLTPVADDRSRPVDAGHNLVMVAFQFGIPQEERPAAMRTYVDARRPALERHGGRLVLSALSERNATWEFDGMEIIDFPRPDGVQALMGDEDYLTRTKQASAVFAGSFAMGVLAQA